MRPKTTARPRTEKNRNSLEKGELPNKSDKSRKSLEKGDLPRDPKRRDTRPPPPLTLKNGKS